VKAFIFLPVVDEEVVRRENRGLGTDRMMNRLSISQEQSSSSNIVNNNNDNHPIFIDDPDIKIGYQIIDDKKNNKVKTVIRLDELNDVYIKTMTGFSSLVAMIAYIIIVNNGEYEKIQTTITQLTWLEEWLVFFECVWGKSCVRWVDLQLRYKTAIVTLREIFDNKTDIVKRCCFLQWPRFVSFDEDISHRKQKWDDFYYGKRLVMWDNTNINMCFKPTVFETQRITYSQYYGGNVAKGGVFIQPCGWIGTHELWTGGISDSEYMI
jgi:hypothetical protein